MNKLARFKTLKVRILIFAIVMSLVPLIILGGYNLQAARGNLEAAVSYHHAYDTSRIAAEINTMIEEAVRTFSILAKTEANDFHLKSVKERERILYACLTTLPYVYDISAMDQEGKELAHVSRLEVTAGEPLNIQDSSSILKNFKTQKMYIGKVFMDDNNQPAFELAIPFLNAKQGFSGGIIAKISLRSIIERISLVSNGNEEYIFLVDEQGNLIGHEDYSQVLRHVDVHPSIPSSDTLKKGAEEGFPLVRNYRSYTGENVVGAYAPIKGTQWAVILEQPEIEAYRSFDKLKRTFILSTVFLILVVLGISLIFSIKLNRRLDEVKQGVRRIHQGEWGFTLPVHEDDEIGEVLKAFNHLSQELERKKQMEGAMRQADKMVTVGLLAAGVAHEINNPLATIFLSVEELIERLDEGELETTKRLELQRYLKTIAEQSERCSAITRQLLDFAHQNSNEEPQSLINVNDLITKILGFIEFRLRKQDIQLKLKLAEKLPFHWGDASAIQQVIFNLICNSIGGMPEGGVLTIYTSFEDDWVIFSIEDNGIGIPEENLSRIFEPFFTTKPVGKGTGLGLSVCYGLIQKAHGKIEIESSQGLGTVVKVSLPRKGDQNEQEH